MEKEVPKPTDLLFFQDSKSSIVVGPHNSENKLYGAIYSSTSTDNTKEPITFNFDVPKGWGKHAKIASLFDIYSVDDIDEEYMFMYSHSSQGTEASDPTLYYTNQDGTLKGSIKPEGLPNDFAGYNSTQIQKKDNGFVANAFSLANIGGDKKDRNVVKGYYCTYT